MALHPLDPLTAQEIKESSEVIKEHFPGQQLIFNSITRLEPPKNVLFPQLILENEAEGKEDFSQIDRKSFTVIIVKETGSVFEIVINLTEKSIESVTKAPPGSQTTFTPDECILLEKLTLENPTVQERCRALGFHDMTSIVADPWPFGFFGEVPSYENRRIAQMFMYFKTFPEDNHYAHPLNFIPVFDILSEKLIRIEEQPAHSDFEARTDKPLTLPKSSGNYEPKLIGPDFYREPVKPLVISSPEGPNFQVDGNLVSWQNFKFRLSFNQREGLVLHNVSYKDGDKVRPLLYRAALSEMVVPYADPRSPFHRKCAFDVGESSLGYCVNSLKLGCDCLGTIKYFDAILNNHAGEAVHIPNAVCLHEEDAGVLWKHSNYRTKSVTVVRSTALIISFIVTVVNYEYGFYWKFTQDGTISYEVKATGILSTNLVADEVIDPKYGTIIAPNVIGQYHQHLFNVRLDTMIDGLKNSVTTQDVVPLEGAVGSEENPFGQGFTVEEKKFRNNDPDSSQISPFTTRTWKIFNPASVNEITQKPAAWKLIPENSQTLIAKPGSKIRERAGFSTNSMWMTPYKDGQIYAAGFYVNQSNGGGGVEEWTCENDDSESSEDIVIWHTFGLTHIPRVEDYPVMPVETCGFKLKPCNFFTMNPGLNIPPVDKNGHSLQV